MVIKLFVSNDWSMNKNFLLNCDLFGRRKKLKLKFISAHVCCVGIPKACCSGGLRCERWGAALRSVWGSSCPLEYDQHVCQSQSLECEKGLCKVFQWTLFTKIPFGKISFYFNFLVWPVLPVALASSYSGTFKQLHNRSNLMGETVGTISRRNLRFSRVCAFLDLGFVDMGRAVHSGTCWCPAEVSQPVPAPWDCALGLCLGIVPWDAPLGP